MRIPTGLMFALFIGVPVLELYLLITIGGEIGALTTVILVLLTAFIGVNLLRQQGLSTMHRAQSRMQDGGLPAMEMLEGVALLIAGAFLLTPGFLTDTAGFLLLIPPSRRAILRWLMRRGAVHVQGRAVPPENGQPRQKQTIDAESWHEDH